MPCGSRPSIAALTRSGARKASEIVMLIFRALQFSRLAMLSAFAVGSAMSSPSQRRPRAIAATNRARVSERIGRACSGRIPSGKRISRRRLAGVFCHGTSRVLGGSARWMTNRSGWTSTRATRVWTRPRSSQGQQDIEGQASHRGCGVELLGDRHKRHIMLVEEFDQFGKIRQRPGQPVDLVDDNDINLAGPHIA
jgi:hypothetical protein